MYIREITFVLQGVWVNDTLLFGYNVHMLLDDEFIKPNIILSRFTTMSRC